MDKVIGKMKTRDDYNNDNNNDMINTLSKRIMQTI